MKNGGEMMDSEEESLEGTNHSELSKWLRWIRDSWVLAIKAAGVNGCFHAATSSPEFESKH